MGLRRSIRLTACVVPLLAVRKTVYGLVSIEVSVQPETLSVSRTSALTSGASIWLADAASSNYQKDVVARVLDANTIKLERSGILSLAGVTTPSATSGYQFPPCFNYSPEFKLKQLLPPKTPVQVQLVGKGQAIIILVKDDMVVNEQLVRAGFAKVRNNNLAEHELPTGSLQALQDQAVQKGLGIFQQCRDSDGQPQFVAEFEEIMTDSVSVIPNNPGDAVGCSDFATYEDALSYYEKYVPYYGDVAKLDRDGDGVPCPKLPHTSNPEKYRMKKPASHQ